MSALACMGAIAAAALDSPPGPPWPHRDMVDHAIHAGLPGPHRPHHGADVRKASHVEEAQEGLHEQQQSDDSADGGVATQQCAAASLSREDLHHANTMQPLQWVDGTGKRYAWT